MIILSLISLIVLLFILFLRFAVSAKYVSTIDLFANISAAFIGVFFALAADDYRKKSDEKVESIHALLAAQVGIIESTRPLRISSQLALNYLKIQDENTKRQLLKDFNVLADAMPIQPVQISNIFLANEDLLRSTDDEIIYFIVRQDALLASFARAYNTQAVDNVKRAMALSKYIFTTDETSMRICVYRSYVNKIITEQEYAGLLNWHFSGDSTIPPIVVKAGCEPRSTPTDFVKWLTDRAQSTR